MWHSQTKTILSSRLIKRCADTKLPRSLIAEAVPGVAVQSLCTQGFAQILVPVPSIFGMGITELAFCNGV